MRRDNWRSTLASSQWCHPSRVGSRRGNPTAPCTNDATRSNACSADLRAFEHLFDDPKIACVRYEISAIFRLPWAPKWHVVAENVVLDPIGIDNRSQTLMRLSPIRIVKLAILEFCPSDDGLLRGYRQRFPIG